ncbi:MAG: putative toxin-antitoxin system toxin component, PIN family [Acidimicrobiales bacterium]
MERVVIDPAVLIGALITPDGYPATLWRAVLAEQIAVVVCPRLLAELAGVLERPKFRRYATLEEARAFVVEVARYGESLSDPTVPLPPASRDPNDDYLVALAKTAVACALVSGDHDLTEMPDANPPALTPRQAVEELL